MSKSHLAGAFAVGIVVVSIIAVAGLLLLSPNWTSHAVQAIDNGDQGVQGPAEPPQPGDTVSANLLNRDYMTTTHSGGSPVTSVANLAGVWQVGMSDLYVQINPDGTVLVGTSVAQTQRGAHVEQESGRNDYLLTANITLDGSRMRWAEAGGTMYMDQPRYPAYHGLLGIGLYDVRLFNTNSQTELRVEVVSDSTMIGRSATLGSRPWVYVGPIAE